MHLNMNTNKRNNFLILKKKFTDSDLRVQSPTQEGGGAYPLNKNPQDKTHRLNSWCIGKHHQLQSIDYLLITFSIKLIHFPDLTDKVHICCC